MKELLKTRLSSPNNVTSKLSDYLESLGIKIQKVGKGRRVVFINNKKYALTFTNYNCKNIQCRQFSNEDGIISMYEKNGQIYIIDKKDLNIGKITRSMNKVDFYNAKSMKEIQELKPTLFIKQINTNNYKNVYNQVGKEYAQNIIKEISNRTMN